MHQAKVGGAAKVIVVARDDEAPTGAPENSSGPAKHRPGTRAAKNLQALKGKKKQKAASKRSQAAVSVLSALFLSAVPPPAVAGGGVICSFAPPWATRSRPLRGSLIQFYKLLIASPADSSRQVDNSEWNEVNFALEVENEIKERKATCRAF